jgi:hypothetical protein
VLKRGASPFFFAVWCDCGGEWLSVTQALPNGVKSLAWCVLLLLYEIEIFPLASHVELAIYLFIYLLLI